MNDIIYTDAPVEVETALTRSVPVNISIHDLVKQNKKTRITIMIDQENLDFFRKEAKVHGIPYQTMINNTLTATRAAIQN